MGSGKSYICRLFEQQEIPVYYTDLAAKRIMVENDEVKYMVKKMLKRPDVYYPDGTLNKELMRQLLFASPDADANRGAINLAIGTYLHQDYEEWLKKHGTKLFTLCESAILYETGFFKKFDKIIYVTAPLELRIKRAVERDGMTAEQYHERMGKQLDGDLKVRASDYVIPNDGYHDMTVYVKEFIESTREEFLKTI